MKRGEVWWAEFSKPAGRRPVVLLSGEEAYQVRELITVAPITTRIRNLPVEVPLGLGEGLPRSCVANLDTVITIPKKFLSTRVCLLPSEKMKEINAALCFSLGLA
ncbi:MAG: type II toxin-antitoxin system PemK/MazF family toxin [Pseudomonadota bacterium]